MCLVEIFAWITFRECKLLKCGVLHFLDSCCCDSLIGVKSLFHSWRQWGLLDFFSGVWPEDTSSNLWSWTPHTFDWIKLLLNRVALVWCQGEDWLSRLLKSRVISNPGRNPKNIHINRQVFSSDDQD